jgi:hypothetical protein
MVLLGGIFIFIAMLLINILQIGGRTWVSTVNTLTLIVFSVFASVQAVLYWRSIQNRAEANRVWLVLGLGLGFYTLGNVVWLFYNLNGIEAPYPSLGDFFWLFAYPLLALALINKNSLLGMLPGRKQTALILTLSAALFLLLGYFILLPMLQFFEADRAVETALNIFYPAMDFIILNAAAFLVVNMWKGKLSLTWNIIAAGFFCWSITDALFIYATWNGLYYAEGSLNLLTRVVDIGYGLASLVVALGVYVQQQVVAVEPEKLEFEFTRSLPKSQPILQVLPFNSDAQRLFEKMLFMVDREQRVFFFSKNYRDLCKLTGGNPNVQWGTPLHLVYGIEASVVNQIFAEIQEHGKTAKPADITIGNYRIPVVIQARGARNGADIFLQYRLEDKAVVIEEKLSPEAVLIDETLRSVGGMESAGIEAKEALTFFVIEVQELYVFLVQMGGFRVGQVLVEKFNRLAVDKGAGVRITDGRVALTDMPEPGTMSSLLGLTIRTVQDLTSIEATREVIKQLNAKIPENIIHSAQNTGLAL